MRKPQPDAGSGICSDDFHEYINYTELEFCGELGRCVKVLDKRERLQVRFLLRLVPRKKFVLQHGVHCYIVMFAAVVPDASGNPLKLVASFFSDPS